VVLNYGQHVLRFLKSIQIETKVSQKFPGTTATVEKDGCLLLKGSNVNEAKAYIETEVSSSKEESFHIPKAHFEHLKSLKNKDIIQNFREKRVWAGWGFEEPNKIYVCSSTYAKTQEARGILCQLSGSRNTRVQEYKYSIVRVQKFDFLNKLNLPKEQSGYLKRPVKSEIISCPNSCCATNCQESCKTFHAKKLIEKAVGKNYKKSTSFLACLKKIEHKEVTTALNNSNVIAGWDIRENKLWVCSACDKDVETAYQAISDLVIEITYPKQKFTPEEVSMLNRNWAKLENGLHEQISNMVMHWQEELSQIIIAVPSSEHVPGLLDILDEFFPSQEQSLPLPSISNSELLLERNIEVIEKLVHQQAPMSNVEIRVEGKSLKIQARPKRYFDQAIGIIQKEMSSIAEDMFSINQTGLIKWLRSQQSKPKLETIAAANHTVYEVIDSQLPKTAFQGPEQQMEVVSGSLSSILVRSL